jgi:hypothetical protein
MKKVAMVIIFLVVLFFSFPVPAPTQEITREHLMAWAAMMPDCSTGRMEFWDNSGDVMIVSDKGSFVLFSGEDITPGCHIQLKKRFDNSLLKFSYRDGLVEPHFSNHEDDYDYNMILEQCS